MNKETKVTYKFKDDVCSEFEYKKTEYNTSKCRREYDYDLGECQGHKYTDGAAIRVSNQIDICKQITDIQADIDSNTFDMSVKRMWKDADEEMLGKRYDRLVKKGEITPPTTQAIPEEDS